MKLTQQVKKAFIEGVLTNEVETPNFAEQIEAYWVEIVSGVIPICVAAIYKNAAIRDWVNPAKVMEIRKRIAESKVSDLSVRTQSFLDSIADVEAKRAKHQTTLDNIRDAITTAADSVTTVEGLRKILPQYTKYLPAGSRRPTSSQAKDALQGLDAAIKTANIIAAPGRAPAKTKAPRKRRASPEKKVV